jgi:hypothetical protein
MTRLLLALALLAGCGSGPTAPPACPLVQRDTLRADDGAPKWIVEVHYCPPAPLTPNAPAAG